MLPYEATHSLRALLDFLCTQKSLENRWRAVVVKMGLYLVNPYARISWYILHSSFLYTFETVVKLRKPNLTYPNNLYYRDIPSYKSGPNNKKQGELQTNITFRDLEWETGTSFTEAVTYKSGEEKIEFYLGVLSHPFRT